MADFWAFKIEVLAWLCHRPLAKTRHLVERVLRLVLYLRLLLEQWDHRWRNARLLPSKVHRHRIVRDLLRWHRERFEKAFLFAALKLTDLLF